MRQSTWTMNSLFGINELSETIPAASNQTQNSDLLTSVISRQIFKCEISHWPVAPINIDNIRMLEPDHSGQVSIFYFLSQHTEKLLYFCSSHCTTKQLGVVSY